MKDTQTDTERRTERSLFLCPTLGQSKTDKRERKGWTDRQTLIDRH